MRFYFEATNCLQTAGQLPHPFSLREEAEEVGNVNKLNKTS